MGGGEEEETHRAAVALLEVGDRRVLRGLAGAGDGLVVEAVRAAVKAVALHAELAAVARLIRLGRLVFRVSRLRCWFVLRLGVCVDVHSRVSSAHVANAVAAANANANAAAQCHRHCFCPSLCSASSESCSARVRVRDRVREKNWL